MRTCEDLKAYLTEFYGKQAIDSNSYWIPLKYIMSMIIR